MSRRLGKLNRGLTEISLAKFYANLYLPSHLIPKLCEFCNCFTSKMAKYGVSFCEAEIYIPATADARSFPYFLFGKSHMHLAPN